MKTTIKTLILLAAFVTGSETYAQRIDVKWGLQVASKSKTEIERIIGQDETGFYLLKSEYRGYGTMLKRFPLIEKCDFKCKPLFTQEITFPAPDGKDIRDMVLEDIMLVDNKLTVFTSSYNKNNDHNSAFTFKLDERGRPEKGFTEIDKISANKKDNIGSFGFVLSKDSTKILAYHNEPYEKKESEKFAIKVLDNNMGTEWERNVVLPYKDKDVSIVNWTLSNNGKVYILAKYQDGRREKKSGSPNYDYILLSYFDAKSQPVEHSLSLGEDFISDITFNISRQGDLICAGFYSKESSEYADGVFYTRISGKTHEILSKNQKKFDSPTREKFMGKGDAGKGVEIPSLDMRGMVLREDGGAVILGEQHWTSPSSQVNSDGSIAYRYYFNAILAINVTPEGKITWMTAVPKSQYSDNDGGYYSSYGWATYSDKVILIYNDHKKNLSSDNPEKIKMMYRINKANAVAVIIDNKGITSKVPLLNSETTKEVYCRPKVSLQSASNKLILIAKKKNGDYMLGTVSFQ